MSTIIQRAFSGGEVSPSLRYRVDTAKYQTGLATLRNFQVQRYGGATNRTGSQFIGEVKNSNLKVRLIPFVFNASQTYVLEFGHLYMRVIKQGAYVTDRTVNITAATNANPGVFTSNSHSLALGDQVSITGGFGFANRMFTIESISPNTFTLRDFNGAVLDTTALGTFTATTAKRIYTLLTPFVEADLPLIQYVQSADVITMTHQNYAPKRLSRLDDFVWQLFDYTFAPSIYPGISATPGLTAGAAGAVRSVYAYTGVAKETGEESLLYLELKGTINFISMSASPTTVTTNSNHGLTTGDRVRFSAATVSAPVDEIQNREYTVTVTGATTFTIDANTSLAASQAGGTAIFRIGFALTSAAPTTTNPNRITFPADMALFDEMSAVNIYKYDTNDFYYLGTLLNNGSGVFLDVGLNVDKSSSPPVSRNPFDGEGRYPAACAYIQQRLVFANTKLEPEKVWTSRTGSFGNFTVSTPSQDDQAVTFTMAGKQVNAVRYLIDVGQFLVLTSGGEWAIQGSDGVLTPTGINPKQYSYNGSAEGLQPIIIDNTALYTQARGSNIRDLGYKYESDGYTGNDLTVYSSHLFDKYTLKDWAYQQVPQSILWVVRDDGILLGLTYVKDQQILAWHHHDTDGFFENVCTVPEGNEDVLYAVVRRIINGRTCRYVERFPTRKVLDIRDARFMDSSITYDGRNKTATTMTLSGSGWTFEDQLTLTASSATFSSSDVGNGVHLYDVAGEILRVRISAYTSPTVVSVYPERTVPVILQGFAVSNWSKAVKSLKGLQHLEGKPVAVFADANVVSSPNNPSYDTLTVTGGAVTFDKPYAVIQVGLSYLSDLETLNIDSAQNETLIDKEKLVSKVSIAVEETRGGFIGARKPSGADPTLNLTEFKPRSDEPYDDPAELVNGRLMQNIASSWNSSGRVFLRQVDPLPMSILAIAPSGKLRG